MSSKWENVLKDTGDFIKKTAAAAKTFVEKEVAPLFYEGVDNVKGLFHEKEQAEKVSATPTPKITPVVKVGNVATHEDVTAEVSPTATPALEVLVVSSDGETGTPLAGVDE